MQQWSVQNKCGVVLTSQGLPSIQHKCDRAHMGQCGQRVRACGLGEVLPVHQVSSTTVHPADASAVYRHQAIHAPESARVPCPC